MTQNIFDNDEFFSAYMDLRLHRKNYNDFMEQPKMQKLMPDSKVRRYWISDVVMGITVFILQKTALHM